MRIGLYTPRICPVIGIYDHFRIIEPVLKQLNDLGHELYLIKDIKDEDKLLYGTDSCYDWTKFVKLGSLNDCDALFMVAMANMSSLRLKVLDIVKNFNGPIIWYDTDAEFDRTTFIKGRTSLESLIKYGYNNKVHIVCPFKTGKIYYDGLFKWDYLPFAYDPSYELPIKSKDSRNYLIKFAGSPIYRPYLATGIYFIQRKYPDSKILLYGTPGDDLNPGWTSYEFLKNDNTELRNRKVSFSSKKFYEWLSDSLVGVHIAGGSSHGYVQRLLDNLYAGCLFFTDFFYEIDDLNLHKYLANNAGMILNVTNRIVNMSNDDYINEVTRIRKLMNDKFNYVDITNKLIDIINNY